MATEKTPSKTSKPKAEKTEKTEKKAPAKSVVVEKKATGKKTTTETVAAKTEGKKSFADLKSTREPVAAAPVKNTQVQAERRKKRSVDGRIMQNGARKNAGARVFLKPGSGKITVNGRDITVYFARPVLRMMINQPFQIAQREGQYDVQVNVRGGGLSGQAGAVRHGIARALCEAEPDLRKALKAEGFLTRDARVVERKKFGRAKARRRFQFSKR